MCSRILWRDEKGDAVIVGRSMDWFEDIGSNMWILPVGIERNGLARVNPLKWTSRYGSLVTTAYDIGTADGVNEKGLDGNMLFLAESDYGRRDGGLPGLSLSLWLQFFLDNFATVEESVDYMTKHPFQLLPVMAGIAEKKQINVHLSLADKSGDSAIIEYVDGVRAIYHDRGYCVMTNSPTFDKQIEGMKRYMGFGGHEDLPGSTKAADRFVRAAYYLEHLPRPESWRQEIAGVFSVLRNVSQPFGTADPDEPNTSPTRWRTVADLTGGYYFYESSMSPYMIWADMNKIDFSVGVRKLTLVGEPDFLGDVTGEFEPSAIFRPAAPDGKKTPMAGLVK
jgi:penicillin V acylase-like amidase (Ntn superfamily)